MEGEPPWADVRLCGHLRKPKSERRRFFALRAPSALGPARLECYESEKKFRAGGARPKCTFPLAGALNIHKRADARHRHLVVLYGRDGTFGLAAENAAEQQAWYSALVELHAQGQPPPGSGPPSPAPFREVWQVSLRPRGLGQAKNLAGVYRLCLAAGTVELVRLRASAACLAVQLPSVRRCGHAENFFFLEVGRSAATGPGELWMQAEDPVVARNIHETVLEAMKALSREGRPQGRGPAAAAAAAAPARRPPPPPPAAAGRRPGTGGDPSSDEGASSSPEPGRRRRKPAPAGASASSPEGLDRAGEPGYVPMRAGGPPDEAYVAMGPAGRSPPRGEAGGYMLMFPGGRRRRPPAEYVNMSPLAPAGPFFSLPRAFKAAVPGSSASSQSPEEPGEESPPAPGPGEYVSIRPRPAWGEEEEDEGPGLDLGLNYIDLDLAREAGGPAGRPRAGAGASPQAYASIDFRRSQELGGRRGGKDRPGC